MPDAREELESQLAVLVARRDHIVNNPGTYRGERLGEINTALKGKKGGPGAIRERHSVVPGRVSMWDHLHDLLKQYAMDPPHRNERILADIDRLNVQIQGVENELAEVS